MKKITIKEILNITKGELIAGNENHICEKFSRDTRNIEKRDTYIALKGEKYNGNIFWKEALKKGADTVIIEEGDFSNENLNNYKNIIKVKNTTKALKDIATYKRSLYNIPIIAVTGSVGKTSTKDIIARVLSQKYKTLKTQGNMNNGIGLPFTILNLKDEEIAVIEMGMNHIGEISELSKIAKPTLSVITNIGTSHIGNLGSRENILKAKLEILDGMEDKKIIINNDNDLLQYWYKNNLKKYNIKKENVYTYGIENKSEVEAKNIILSENGSEFDCINTKENKSQHFKLFVGGKHFIYNAMCSAIIGKIFNLTDEQIYKGIKSFRTEQKRMNLIVLQNGAKIINDSYNASYESIKASLEYLKNATAVRKIAVLGDMFELGEFSKSLHEKVGEEVVKNNIDLLICSGENSKYIIDGAIKNGMNKNAIYYFEKKEQIEKKLKKILVKGDIVLVKASNGMKYFEIVNNLIENNKNMKVRI